MTVQLPRPTKDSDPFKSLVVDALRGQDDVCRHCGENILPCGFDCAFGGYIHLGKNAGSHKCGHRYRNLDAAP